MRTVAAVAGASLIAALAWSEFRARGWVEEVPSYEEICRLAAEQADNDHERERIAEASKGAAALTPTD